MEDIGHFLSLTHTHTHDTQRLPTLGACAVVLALQLCDQVSLAGFGYDLQHPQARLHYYEALRMGAMKAQVRDVTPIEIWPCSTSGVSTGFDLGFDLGLENPCNAEFWTFLASPRASF